MHEAQLHMMSTLSTSGSCLLHRICFRVYSYGFKELLSPSSSVLFPLDCIERHITVQNCQASIMRCAVMFLCICPRLKCFCSGQEFLCLNSPRAGLYACCSRWLPSPYAHHYPSPSSESWVIGCAVRKLCQFCEIIALIRAFFSLSLCPD